MEVAVIGAGAAGLAAAYRLCQSEVQTEVIDACEQVGGRIRTESSGLPKAPFELGAEFIHGGSNSVWDLMRTANLTANEVPENNWLWSDHKFTVDNSINEELVKCWEEIDVTAPDVSVDEFLRTRAPVRLQWLIRHFVEGFFAAQTTKISAHSIASGSGDEDESYRIQGGYRRLVDWLRGGIERSGGTMYLNTLVEVIKWRRGKVELHCQTPEGPRTLRASRAIITLPLGVLAASPGELGSVRFEPSLEPKRAALAGLEMGKIVKIQYRFDRCFWAEALGSEDFGFIHAREGKLRTWWSVPFGPILTGWTGGAIDNLDKMEIVEAGLRELSVMFNLSLRDLKDRLQDWRFHDWRTDPFTRGAYSYTKVGCLHAPDELAKSLERTLYFAGEATVSGPAQGTVHGAIDSGFRAADEVMRHRAAQASRVPVRA